MYWPYVVHIPYSGKVWQGETLANLLFLSIWRKKVWRMNRSANRLSIVTTDLDGFSLANHRRFATFAAIWYIKNQLENNARAQTGS